MIGNQAGQILQSVQGLSPMSDDKADIIAGKVQYRAAFHLFNIDLDPLGPHFL